MEETYRIIDANLNRAREGLRVGEEIARFILNNKLLTEEFKKIRHKLKGIIDGFPLEVKDRLISERDSSSDVGLSLGEKEKRENYKEVALANLRRSEEAIRVLEEFGGLINTKFSLEFEKVRFKIYTLEKKIIEKLKITQRFLSFKLYVIISGDLLDNRTYEEVAKEVIKGGVKTIQLREKKRDTRTLIKIGQDLREITSAKKATFIINDRVDVAMAVQADGIHLGQEDMPLKLARRIMGENKIIGISTHNIEQACQAEEEGADYIGVGPIFPTQTKDYLPVGINLISEVKRMIKIPFVVLGGIKESNIEEVKEAGAEKIAVSSAILKSSNIKEATKKLNAKINS